MLSTLSKVSMSWMHLAGLKDNLVKLIPEAHQCLEIVALIKSLAFLNLCKKYQNLLDSIWLVGFSFIPS